MQIRKRHTRIRVRRLPGKRRALPGDDDPLFDDRELEFCGCGDEKTKPPEE